jgi:Fe-S-cluster containining protein
MDADRIAGTNDSQASFQSLDSAFVALVDGAFADAAARSGPHLLCRPGCTQCCTGVFPVGPADALRLKQGLEALAREDPEHAARVRGRAAASWLRLEPQFPGDRATGALDLDTSGEPVEAFDHFGNNEPCPALEPEHGTCALYASRPETCRVFGPPVATGEGFGMCELCFQTATVQEIAAAAIRLPSETDSKALDQSAMGAGAFRHATIVAFVLSAG